MSSFSPMSGSYDHSDSSFEEVSKMFILVLAAYPPTPDT
ncbi:hypothetical protein TNCV_3868841, partial [Trichonephila clavipes]